MALPALEQTSKNNFDIIREAIRGKAANDSPIKLTKKSVEFDRVSKKSNLSSSSFVGSSRITDDQKTASEINQKVIDKSKANPMIPLLQSMNHSLIGINLILNNIMGVLEKQSKLLQTGFNKSGAGDSIIDTIKTGAAVVAGGAGVAGASKIKDIIKGKNPIAPASSTSRVAGIIQKMTGGTGKALNIAGKAFVPLTVAASLYENKDELLETCAVDPLKQIEKIGGGLGGFWHMLAANKNAEGKTQDFLSMDTLGNVGDVLSGATGTVLGTGTQVGKAINDLMPESANDAIGEGIDNLLTGFGLWGKTMKQEAEETKVKLEEAEKEKQKKREEEKKEKLSSGNPLAAFDPSKPIPMYMTDKDGKPIDLNKFEINVTERVASNPNIDEDYLKKVLSDDLARTASTSSGGVSDVVLPAGHPNASTILQPRSLDDFYKEAFQQTGGNSAQAMRLAKENYKSSLNQSSIPSKVSVEQDKVGTVYTELKNRLGQIPGVGQFIPNLEEFAMNAAQEYAPNFTGSVKDLVNQPDFLQKVLTTASSPGTALIGSNLMTALLHQQNAGGLPTSGLGSNERPQIQQARQQARIQDTQIQNQTSGQLAKNTAMGVGGILAAQGVPGASTAVNAISKIPGDWKLGQTSKKYEVGKGGAGTVSSGAGDYGGVSYGSYQMSSKMGVADKFIQQSPWAQEFAGMKAGSSEFTAKWKDLAKRDPSFGEAQHEFIKKTHYDPHLKGLQKAGIDLSERGAAVQDMLWSTGVQFGGGTKLVEKALAGKDISKMTDSDIVTAVQDYKIANNSKLFSKSNANVREGTLKRAEAEKKDLQKLSDSGISESTPRKVGTISEEIEARAKEIPGASYVIDSLKEGLSSATEWAGANNLIEAVGHPDNQASLIAAASSPGTALIGSNLMTAMLHQQNAGGLPTSGLPDDHPGSAASHGLKGNKRSQKSLNDAFVSSTVSGSTAPSMAEGVGNIFNTLKGRAINQGDEIANFVGSGLNAVGDLARQGSNQLSNLETPNIGNFLDNANSFVNNGMNSLSSSLSPVKSMLGSALEMSTFNDKKVNESRNDKTPSLQIVPSQSPRERHVNKGVESDLLVRNPDSPIRAITEGSLRFSFG